MLFLCIKSVFVTRPASRPDGPYRYPHILLWLRLGHAATHFPDSDSNSSAASRSVPPSLQFCSRPSRESLNLVTTIAFYTRFLELDLASVSKSLLHCLLPEPAPILPTTSPPGFTSGRRSYFIKLRICRPRKSRSPIRRARPAPIGKLKPTTTFRSNKCFIFWDEHKNVLLRCSS